MVIWCKQSFPSLLRTFNEPCDRETIQRLHTFIGSQNNTPSGKKHSVKFPVSYAIWMGECMNGQSTLGGSKIDMSDNSTDKTFFGLFGSFKSYQYRYSSHLLAVEEAIELSTSNNFVYNDKRTHVKNESLFLFAAGFAQCFSPNNLTFIRLNDLKIVKQDSRNYTFDELSHSDSFLINLEYYVSQLMHSSYRLSLPLCDKEEIEKKKKEKKKIEKSTKIGGNDDVEYDSDNPDTRTAREKQIEASAYASNPSLNEDIAYGILRYPINQDKNNGGTAVHVHEKHGNITLRGCPIFVSELSVCDSSGFKRLVFPYHIEIECPQANECKDHKILDECPSGQLKTRIWTIKDGEKSETFEGPGVIGLYPRIGVNQPIFSYESMSHQKNMHGGKMGGFFTFELDKTKEMWKATVPFYTLDTSTTEWL